MEYLRFIVKQWLLLDAHVDCEAISCLPFGHDDYVATRGEVVKRNVKWWISI